MSHDEKPPSDQEAKIAQNLSNNKSALSDSLPYPDANPLVPDSNDELVTAELLLPKRSAHDPYEEIITAEIVPPHQVSRTVIGRSELDPFAARGQRFHQSTPPIPEDMEHVAAVGGAVGALVLGVWALIGCFITPWSVINSILGLLLGMWGMTSRRRRWAIIGMVLCGIAFVLSTMQISEWIRYLFSSREDELGL